MSVESADTHSIEDEEGLSCIYPYAAGSYDSVSAIQLYYASPAVLPVLWNALKPYQTSLTLKLWMVLDSAKPEDDRLIRASSALARFDPDNANWDKVGSKVAKAMVSVDPASLGTWLKALRPVRSKLVAPLASIFRAKDRSESQRNLATSILADYASDDPDLLTDLLLDSEGNAFTLLFDRLNAHQERVLSLLDAELAKKAPSEAKVGEKDQLAQRQARAAVVQVRLGQGEKVWTLLCHSPDPSLRSYLVNWLKPLGADPKTLIAKLESLPHDPVPIPKDGKSCMDTVLFHPETSQRRALILALGLNQA